MSNTVSVIIPVYNVKKYIDSALKSVISQSYSNLDIIIIDDGSFDGSGQICDYYASLDCRIRVIHQVNKGLSAARNVGLDLAIGEYIVFFDPDDILRNNMIKAMIWLAVKRNADIVACNIEKYYVDWICPNVVRKLSRIKKRVYSTNIY